MLFFVFLAQNITFQAKPTRKSLDSSLRESDGSQQRLGGK